MCSELHFICKKTEKLFHLIFHLELRHVNYDCKTNHSSNKYFIVRRLLLITDLEYFFLKVNTEKKEKILTPSEKYMNSDRVYRT